jgi:hypothetical protein
VATIDLKPEEALVLIDSLIRFRDSNELRVDHPAEQHILWDLCAILESQVPELIAPDYQARLAIAWWQETIGNRVVEPASLADVTQTQVQRSDTLCRSHASRVRMAGWMRSDPPPRPSP